MKKEYEIEIREILSRIEKVEGESLDDAINRAMEMYQKEEIVLDAEDFKSVDFDEYKDTIDLGGKER